MGLFSRKPDKKTDETPEKAVQPRDAHGRFGAVAGDGTVEPSIKKGVNDMDALITGLQKLNTLQEGYYKMMEARANAVTAEAEKLLAVQGGDEEGDSTEQMFTQLLMQAVQLF